MTPVSCHILMGGLAGPDGLLPLVNTGMYHLRDMLKNIPGVIADIRTWNRWAELTTVVPDERKRGLKVAVIGYSGGGMCTTYLASWLCRHDPGADGVIDLAVGYDPSPREQILPFGVNVAQAICYHNTAPFMFGYGGGLFTLTHGNTVTKLVVRNIAEWHMTVQYDSSLHQQTLEAVTLLAS
jgi:hypothetical protein